MSRQEISDNYIATIAEHNIKIENIEKTTNGIDLKLSQLVQDFQTLQISLAKSSCPSPGSCISIEPRIQELERISKDLVASKNKVAGAMTIGTVVGSILGIVGTWVIEFYRFKH